jgi:hypothetical protein
MANEVINSTFIGTQAAGYISRATLGADSLAKGVITPRVDVSVPTKIAEIEVSDDLLQPYQEDFHVKGGYTKSERTLDPKLVMVNLSLDKKKLLKDWEALKMTAGAMNKTIPADFMTYVMGRVEDSVARQMESNIWKGDYDVADGYNQKFDGLLVQADAGAVKVTGTGKGAAFTTANIQDAFATAYASLPAEVTEKPDFKFYVSHETLKVYKMSLSNYQNNQTTGDRPVDYFGTEIVGVAGLGRDLTTIVGAQVSNLWFGTDLISDLSTVAIKDMFESTLDQSIRIRMEAFACTQVGFPGEVLIYKTAA